MWRCGVKATPLQYRCSVSQLACLEARCSALAGALTDNGAAANPQKSKLAKDRSGLASANAKPASAAAAIS
jgi:hypothetical protein